jgi:hypothetical protein
MHSHSGESGFTQLWWIQGEISATLTVVEVDKITTKGPRQWGFNGWVFYSFIYPDGISSLFFFLMSRITMATIYYQHICPRKCIAYKKLRIPSLSIKGHVWSQ